MIPATTPQKQACINDSQHAKTPAKRDMAKELAEWKAAKQSKAGKENCAQPSLPATPAATPSRPMRGVHVGASPLTERNIPHETSFRQNSPSERPRHVQCSQNQKRNISSSTAAPTARQRLNNASPVRPEPLRENFARRNLPASASLMSPRSGLYTISASSAAGEGSAEQVPSMPLHSRSAPSLCREIARPSGQNKANSRSQPATLPTDMRLPPSLAEANEALETRWQVAAAPPPSPERHRHFDQACFDQLLRWRSVPHLLSPRRALVAAVVAAFPGACTLSEELSPRMPATSSTAPVKSSQTCTNISEQAPMDSSSVLGASSESRDMPVKDLSEPTETGEAALAIASMASRASALPCGRDVARSSVPHCVTAIPQVKEDALPSAGSVSVQQRLLERLDAVKDIKDVSDELRLKLAKARIQADRQEDPAEASPVEDRPDLVKADSRGGEQQKQQRGQQREEETREDTVSIKLDIVQDETKIEDAHAKTTTQESEMGSDHKVLEVSGTLSIATEQETDPCEKNDVDTEGVHTARNAVTEEHHMNSTGEYETDIVKQTNVQDEQKKQDDSGTNANGECNRDRVRDERQSESADSSDQDHMSREEELHHRHQQILDKMEKLQSEAGRILLAPLAERAALEKDLKMRWEAALAEQQELSRWQSTLDVDRWRQRVHRHTITWPAQTALDMDDHLSRAHDIYDFWFFELRDRVSHALPNFRSTKVPERIQEFPASWPKWRIDSARLRDEAVWRRRKSGGGARQLEQCEDDTPEVSTPESNASQ